MLFCPKCSSILKPKKTSSKIIMACGCGYTSTDISSAKITESVKNKSVNVEVVVKDFQAMPLVPNECSKCKHGKAYYWEIQTRASDEPPTRFYKCEKCQHVWREYK